MSHPNVLLVITDDERYLNVGGSSSTNRITNPQGLLNTTGWTNGGMVTFTAANNLLTTNGLPTGSDALTKGFNFTGDTNGDHIRIDAAVTNGVRYRFSAYVRLSANTATGVRLAVFDAGAVSFATSTTLSATGGSMTRLDIDFTANATATWTFRLAQVGAGGVTGQATAFLLESSSTLNGYFDGSYISCEWVGTAHASNSNSTPVGARDAHPNVNAVFGAGGTEFTRFFVQSPVCGNSRATTYSGLRASQHGVLDIDKTSEWDTWYSVQRQLQQYGMRTGIVGKYNNWLDPEQAPYFDYRKSASGASEVGTILVAFREFLASTPTGQPWFFVIATNIPHEPYTITPNTAINIPTFVLPDSAAETDRSDKHDDVESFGNVTYDPAVAASDYYGMLRELAAFDEQFDNMWAEMTTAQQNNCLAIYMSDNGYCLGDHKLRGKQWPYMASISDPLSIRWTDGGVEAGVNDDRLVSNLDIAPTILGAVGKTSDYEMAGYDLLDATLPHWSGTGEAREYLYLEYPSDDVGIPPWDAYLSGPHSDIRHYIRWLDGGSPGVPVENYNLVTDPTESSASNTRDTAIEALMDATELNPPDEAGTLTIFDGTSELDIPGMSPEVVLGEAEDVSPSAEGRVVRGGLYLSKELTMPKPEYENTYAAGVDSEGNTRVRSRVANATGTGSFFITGDSIPKLLEELQVAVAGCHRNRGWVKWKGPNAAPVTYDIESFSIDIPERSRVITRVAEIPFEFEARAYGRLEESVVFASVAMTGPQDVVAVEPPGGHVDALGNLAVTETSSQTRQYGEVGWDYDPPWYADVLRDIDPYLFWTMGSEDDITVGGVDFLGGFSNQTGAFKNGTANGGVVPGRGASLLEADSATSTIFDGIDDWVSSSVALWTGSSTSFSFSCLAVRDTNATTQTFFGGSNAGSPVLRAPSGGSTVTFRVVESDAGATSSTTWAAALPADGTTFHLAFSFDATANTADLWINGVSQGQKTGLSSGYSTPGNFQVGAFGPTPVNFWDGNLQAVAAWRQTITGATAVELYHAAIRPYYIRGEHLTTSGYGGTSSTRATSVSTNTVLMTAATIPMSVCATGPLPHHGPHRVWARIWPSDSDLRVRLAWKVGNGPLRKEAWVSMPGKSAFYDIDLGLVDIEELPGQDTWEAVIEAASTSGVTTIDVDLIEYIPADSWGRARAPQTSNVADTLLGFDTFLQAGSPALGGATAQIGGVWGSAGGGAAWTVDSTNDYLTRTGTGEVAPRFGSLGSNITTQASQVETWCSASITHERGVICRYTGTSDYLVGVLSVVSTIGYLYVAKFVGGASTILGTTGLRPTPYLAVPNLKWTIRLTADSAGRWAFYVGTNGEVQQAPVLSGFDSALVTGSGISIETGKPGIYDYNSGPNAVTRYMDNFASWGAAVSASNFVLYSGRTAEFTHEAMRRDDSSGAYMGNVPLPEGRYLRLPNKQTRMVTRFRRNDIASGLPSTGTGDGVTADLTATRRVLLGGV